MDTNEMMWRRLPRGIIRDEEIDYIADQLDSTLRCAPYMFYLVALCKADDDGIFDLEDGIIFSRMMRIGTPEDVFKIAELMISRHIISWCGEGSRVMFSSWEYPRAVKPRTIEERREIVRKQMKADENKIVDFSGLAKRRQKENQQSYTVDFSHKPSAFFCPENDKNQKNVVMPIFDDKNQKNVVQKNQTERENRERENSERLERLEHTQETEERQDREKPQLQEQTQSFRCGEEKRETEYIDSAKTENIQKLYDNDLCADEVTEKNEKAESVETGDAAKYNKAYTALVQHFTKNCQVFSDSDVKILAGRLSSLADDKNPADVIVHVFISCFKKMSETAGYYQGIPVSPDYMIKQGPFSHALELCSKILLTQGKQNPEWMRELEVTKAEIQAEKSAVGNPFSEAEVKYGGVAQMLAAIANEQNRENPP